MEQNIRQWEVVWVDLHPAVGAEQTGRRPVLVVSSDRSHGPLGICTVLPITSRKPGRRIYPVEACLPVGACDLPAESIIMAQQIRTVSKERLQASCGIVLDEGIRDAVRKAMRLHLAL